MRILRRENVKLTTSQLHLGSTLTTSQFHNFAMRIYLIGMPGAGKTTLGRELAAAYALPFCDLDAEIVRREGRSVVAIFQGEGEAYFREVEARTLRAVVAAQPAVVVATGGGTPCYHDNLALLLETGLTLYLAVPTDELVRRLLHAAAARPLLAPAPDDAALTARLRETFEVRKQFYERAPLRCAAAACTLAAVRELIGRYRTTA